MFTTFSPCFFARGCPESTASEWNTKFTRRAECRVLGTPFSFLLAAWTTETNFLTATPRDSCSSESSFPHPLQAPGVRAENEPAGRPSKHAHAYTYHSCHGCRKGE